MRDKLLCVRVDAMCVCMSCRRPVDKFKIQSGLLRNTYSWLTHGHGPK
jgi:hypothetical protein